MCRNSVGGRYGEGNPTTPEGRVLQTASQNVTTAADIDEYLLDGRAFASEFNARISARFGVELAVQAARVAAIEEAVMDSLTDTNAKFRDGLRTRFAGAFRVRLQQELGVYELRVRGG